MPVAIRVQLSAEDLAALGGDRRDGTRPTAAAGQQVCRSDGQRQQGSFADAGDKIAFITITILRNVFVGLM